MSEPVRSSQEAILSPIICNNRSFSSFLWAVGAILGIGLALAAYDPLNIALLDPLAPYLPDYKIYAYIAGGVIAGVNLIQFMRLICGSHANAIKDDDDETLLDEAITGPPTGSPFTPPSTATTGAPQPPSASSSPTPLSTSSGTSLASSTHTSSTSSSASVAPSTVSSSAEPTYEIVVNIASVNAAENLEDLWQRVSVELAKDPTMPKLTITRNPTDRRKAQPHKEKIKVEIWCTQEVGDRLSIPHWNKNLSMLLLRPNARIIIVAAAPMITFSDSVDELNGVQIDGIHLIPTQDQKPHFGHISRCVSSIVVAIKRAYLMSISS